MLCYLELVQFLAILCDSNWSIYKIEERIMIDLSDSIPKSMIVDKNKEFIEILNLLANKYFHSSAPFQVNISYGLYSSILKFSIKNGSMNNYDFSQNENIKKQLIELMIQVCDTLLRLLEQSISRFKSKHPQKAQLILEM